MKEKRRLIYSLEVLIVSLGIIDRVNLRYAENEDLTVIPLTFCINDMNVITLFCVNKLVNMLSCLLC